jgi:hypothetical protein
MAITGSLPLYPVTREYHTHLHGDRHILIPEGYDTCPCGREKETLTHLLICPIHEQSLAPTGEAPTMYAKRVLLNTTDKYRETPLKDLVWSTNDPVKEALTREDCVIMLLQSIIPEPVWEALKQTVPRPEYAAAALQRAGLRTLDIFLSTRRETLLHRLSHNTTPTGKTYLYLTCYPGDLRHLPTSIPPPSSTTCTNSHHRQPAKVGKGYAN